MSVGETIIGILVALIAAVSGVYAFFTAQGKGPILSNTYLLLSKAERAKANKKAEYKSVTVVFSCISAIFALLALNIFTSWKWAYIAIIVLIICLIIYVIADSVKPGKKSRK